jgi:hypothetical protein
MNADRAQPPDGHLVIEGDRIRAVGEGPAPRLEGEGAIRRVNGEACPITPGLVNCHHHLYQSVTRRLAQQATLLEWLVELYPILAQLDAEIEDAAARVGRAALARSGCGCQPGAIVTTSSRAGWMTCSRSRSTRRARSVCGSMPAEVAGIEGPVAGFVLGAPRPVELLLKSPALPSLTTVSCRPPTNARSVQMWRAPAGGWRRE